MILTSPGFRDGEKIPQEHTCDGNDSSPHLVIRDVPGGTKSLVILMDDPDAPMGTFDHWVVWNIPPTTREIPKGTEPEGVQGITSFGKEGYGGPCPPSGSHRYFFKLYALDSKLDISEGSTKRDVEQSMEGHVVDEAQLMGTYER